MLWEKWCDMGEGEAGHLVHQICIWPQHMANPGHLTMVLIRTRRQTGCRAVAVSASFFSQHVDLVLVVRTHLPFPGRSPPLLFPLWISSETSLLFRVYFQLASGLQAHKAGLTLRDPAANINKSYSQQKATTAAQSLFREREENSRFVCIKALRKIVCLSQCLG